MIDTTVVVCIKNRKKEDIIKYLEHLKAQAYKHDLIVVDYGSDEKHLEEERELAEKYNFKLIEVKRDTEIFNSGRALNIGFKQVKTPYAITTDGDVLLSENVLAMAVKYLKAKNCIVFCQRFDLNENGTIGKMHGKNAIGTFIGMRTEWIKKIRGADEHFEGYGGWDNDMKHRAEKDGLDIVWLNELENVVILHLWHIQRPHLKMADNIKYLKQDKPVIRNLKEWGEL